MPYYFGIYRLEDRAQIRGGLMMNLGKEVEDRALNIINRIAQDYGLWPTRRKTGFFYYDPPYGAITFGYTPHKTEHEGKIGFYALRIRIYKDGRMSFSKAVRFAKRKIARKRALQWFFNKFGKLPKGWKVEDYERRYGRLEGVSPE